MASGVAAGGGGSPPRATSQDPRLADMPDELSRSEKSAYIIDKCNLKDEMWTLVYCLSKKGVDVCERALAVQAARCGGNIDGRIHWRPGQDPMPLSR